MHFSPNRIFFTIVFVATLTIGSSIDANALSCRKGEECNGITPLLMIPVIIETGIIGASTWAALDPITGSLTNVILPWMVVDSEKNVSAWVMAASGITLFSYNQYQAKQNNKGWDVFAVNFIGWHLVIASYFLPNIFESNHDRRTFTPIYMADGKSLGVRFRLDF